MILDKVHNSLLMNLLSKCSSYFLSFLCLDCDVPTSPQPSVSISVILAQFLVTFRPLSPLVTVEFSPSWLPASPSPLSVVSVLPPPPLSLFYLLPPPLYVSSCIHQVRLCRCVYQNIYLSHNPSTLFRTHLINPIKVGFVTNKSLSASQPSTVSLCLLPVVKWCPGTEPQQKGAS